MNIIKSLGMRFLAHFLAVASIFLFYVPVSALAAEKELKIGYGNFDVVIGSKKRPLTVTAWFFRPANASMDSPVLFVMHGIRRDYDKYLETWAGYARDLGLIVIAPEFTEADFPGLWRYRMGNVYSASGKQKPRQVWAYTAIEKMFDKLRDEYGATAQRYTIWGHGAGAQFVHRLVLFDPQARIDKAIAANAGWYTMANHDDDLPYGLANANLDEEHLRKIFAANMIVMLGKKDNDPNHHRLNREVEAMKQGRHRLARGLHFFNDAKEQAEAMNVPFNWSLKTVSRAKHSRRAMAKAAAKLLSDEK